MRNALAKMGLITSKNPVGAAYRIDEIIQSLSQPKSWKVELEMETLYLEEDSGNYTHEKDDISGSKDFPKLTNGKVKILRLL
jgi:hypothetical protein